MEFYIPLCFDYLTHQNRKNEYYVKESYDQSEIKTKLEEFEENLTANGAYELLEYFDVFYCALKRFNELDSRYRLQLWNYLLACHGFHYNELCVFLSGDIQEDRAAVSDNMRDHRNILQMNVYLLSQLAERFENQRASSDQQLSKKGRKASIWRETDSTGEEPPGWPDQKMRLLRTLYETFQMPLNLLWDPPVVDDQLANCVANICYKIFENPESGKARANNEDCIMLLSLLVNTYRHHSVAAIKIVQQLQHFEHMPSVWAYAVSKFVADGHTQIILDIFRELSSLELDDSTKGGASARNYGLFLTELTELCPDVVLPTISLLVCHLDCECYTMRIAILTIFVELISQKLSGGNLEEKDLQNRDNFLDLLETHLHDKNAFVRSRCFQLWTKLCEENCVPDSRLETLLPIVIGRLVDKGSTVRKGAVQLLTLILRNGPSITTESALFAEQLQSVLPQILWMLRQQQTTDVLESIEFIVTCAEFGVPGATPAVWKCFSLIWSKTPAVKTSVVKAFQRLYLKIDEDSLKNSKDRCARITQTLIHLVSTANLSQRTSLEDVICEAMKEKLISTGVLQILWEKFAAGKNEERKAALKLLGMTAKAEKSIVKDNIELLIKCGLTDSPSSDFELIKDVCSALEKLGYLDKNKDEESLKREPFRLPTDNILFTRLQVLIVEGFTRIDDFYWTPMMERAMKVVFLLADHPDAIAGSIMKSVYEIVKSQDTSYALLTRFVALIGQIALQTFIFVDVAVCRELKRRNLLSEEKKDSQRRNKSRSGKDLLKTPRSTVSKIAAEEEELALAAGGTAEDAELEFVNKVCEEEILAEETILGSMAKFVFSICKQHQTLNDVDLQTAASLALSKLMLVSSKFCEEHLSLLFTMMDKSEMPSVRANIVISVGDLSFRFPNLIEPWTPLIYKRLNDEDLNVRLNCLLILNYLILNDMIKPKGHIADIAVCILDTSKPVVLLAKKFFAEYAEKGNSLYNLLPDIISRLSDSDNEVLGPDEFKSVMKFLFSLIHKERQYESLVEKLCQRFQATRSVEHWRYFSYCLSLIPYNEKCLSKLNEHMPCYAAQLGDVEVNNNFLTILATVKKSAKTEGKEGLVQEMEEKFAQLHERNLMGGDAYEVAAEISASAKKRSRLRK